MLTGTAEGKLLLFDADFNLLDDDFLHFEGAWSTPCLFDVDHDGILDLVVGEASGKLTFLFRLQHPNFVQKRRGDVAFGRFRTRQNIFV